MFKVFLNSISLFIATFCFGQSDSLKCRFKIDTLTNTEVYTIADKMPEVVGGNEILFKEIAKLKYPHLGCYGGKIWVSFIVTADGELIGKRILRDPSGNVFGKQILSLIENVDWEPGQCEGKKVPMFYNLPVNISLRY